MKTFTPGGGGKAAGLHAAAARVLVALSILLPASGIAQTDTVHVPGDHPPVVGSLNTAIRNAIVAGTLSSTVFVLEPDAYYGLTGTVTVPAGQKLTVVAPKPGVTQQTAPPQIVFADTVSMENARINFDCFGNIELKNVWLLHEHTPGYVFGTNLRIHDSPDTVNGQVGTFDGVLFDGSAIPSDASGAVGVSARHFRGTFRNCYFKNCTDNHFRYYGRAVSFPFGSTGWHIDNLMFENCTFANIGYVYNQERGEYGDHVQFNHCTFFNVVMFPLESGWWNWLSVTNSIFVNTWMFGDLTGMRDTEGPNGGTIRIDSVARFGFAVPFTEADRRILFAHNSYFVEEWLRDWMYSNPASVIKREEGHPEEVPVPQPMLSPGTLRFFDSTAHGQKLFPFMNRASLYDSTDPGFLVPPTNLIGLKTFLYFKWWCCSDTIWAYFPELSYAGVWPLQESLKYTNQTLASAGMGGFPLGDLYHWFPDEYTRWKFQEENEHSRIRTWLSNGIDPGGPSDVKELPGGPFPASFVLHQNYPNPFNGTTRIRYELAERSFVSISVTDVLGQEVPTLVDGVQAASRHSVDWNAAGAATGVYFCRMRARSESGAHAFTSVKKLLLLK